ncbi:MAG: glycoside hydrolase [Sulfobacillus thermosulfidooxidans]|uniref:Glycoside hydrolase n=1 Tax=Sulfobacillus thermotolerans TaxID=338644 RepID=A0ABM6RQV6_9FIRM|nr:glycosyl hydrolase family 18 protein [Sulfobacillus sp. hq2]AUW93686.1 glycoside hydrolase [Sulfobacillus thermotolerans]MCY0907225.1 glycosyl hydrolase family 18 protein [Sulfobacillus thermotolerans]PSR37471.1 MAG: glycoside hydrolase [Sulfobacillus thermosulfidooxidans]
MNKRTIKLFTTLGSASILIGGCGLSAEPQKPAPVKKATQATRKSANKAATTVKKAATGGATTGPGELKVIAFYDQTMAHVSPNPFTFVKAHPSLVTYLSPFWYEVTSQGTVIAKPEGNAATLAKQAHLPLMPLFNNYMGTDGMLSTAALRTQAVDQIVKIVTDNHYPGVQIDFQKLKAADRPLLVDFMNELHAKMPKNVSISMSVVPLTAGTGQSGAYDLKALSADVNSMVLMAYDLHSNGTAPGPVSPYPWVKKSIDLALKTGIKPSKLYLGIADYGYLWKAGSTKATTIPLKIMYQHKYGTYTWDPTDKEAYDNYTQNGVKYTLWFVNDRGAVDRIKLAEKDHLGGVGFWRVGYEDAQWWNRVAKALKAAPKPKTSSSGKKASAMAPVSPQHRQIT